MFGHSDAARPMATGRDYHRRASPDIPLWKPWRFVHGLSLLFLSLLLACPLQADEGASDLLSLSWEELNAQEISTLTRKRTNLAQSPAAAFVITAEDIRRSGARTLPDILRMAPGLQVAQINGWDQAVTARGMNGFYANKLLVMMDGRSIFNPFISGVWWGDQNPMLEDIDRIEILRGPGGSLWGGNAFNGVINIVTKRSSDTQGGLAVAGGGTTERGFGGLRYGLHFGESTYLRLFANGLQRSDSPRLGGERAFDGQSAEHGGFRLDSQPSSRDRLTVQGDAFHNEDNWYTRTTQLTPPYAAFGNHTTVSTSGNLLGRWSHAQDDGGEWNLGGYLDYSDRMWPAIGEEHLTFDLDFQHRLAPIGQHELMWGLGYRHILDHFANTLLFSVSPTHYQQNNFSAFFQDEITLLPKELTLTLGSKFEHYTLAGFQVEPNIRLSWTPSPEHNLWAAISRAVAVPNRYERNSRFVIPVSTLPDGSPIFGEILGNRNLGVETVMAYELGWRYAPKVWLKFDTALFYNHYEDILGAVPTGNTITLANTKFLVAPTRYGNYQDINTYGIEIAADYALKKSWHWKLAYTVMGLDQYSNHLSQVPSLMLFKGTQPQHTLSLRSSIDLADAVELDLWLRYASSINPGAFPNDTTAIPAYLTLDARLAWQATPNLELSLVGRNLLDPRHPEFANNFYMPYQAEVERSVYFKAALRF